MKRVEFNIQGTANAQRVIRKRIANLKTAPKTVMEQIAKDQVAEVQNRIRSTKVDAEGRQWAPWSFATMRQRRREGTSSRGLLYRTGRLLNSIRYRISEKTLTIFSNLPYADFLQRGTSKMPARPFLGWTKDSLNRIKQQMTEALRK